MSKPRLSLALALCASPLILPLAAWAGTAPATTRMQGDQAYLVDANQMTLYTFDKDAEGQSNCHDDCAAKWPPLTAAADAPLADGYSLITRQDGLRQVAYKGQPLYLWIKDHAPGDMTGDGVKSVWHIARP